MRPTISELKSWNLDGLSLSGEAAQGAAATVDGALDAVALAFDATRGWAGATHAAADARVREERDHADEIRNVLNQIADETADAAIDLAHAREFVLRTVEAAVAAGFAVSDDGAVTHAEHERSDEADTFEAFIADGLTTVDTVDETYGARLEDLCGDLERMVVGQPDVAVGDGTRRDADDVVTTLKHLRPDERRKLLSRMSTDDRRRLAQADPHAIGNMDGVDFDLRADANEMSIRAALADEFRAGRGGIGHRRADRLRAFLAHRTDPVTGRDVERRFVAFDDAGHGRLIEMIGSFTSQTRHATVLVPGTRSNLNDSQKDSDAAWQLARRTGGPVFLYMDGELPQEVGFEGLPRALALSAGSPLVTLGPSVVASLADTAVEPRFARDMAPRLVGFGKELDIEIACRAPGASTTFIGHSYGGSIVGSAEQLGLRADNVIYASSAGTGVFDGPWHDANPEVRRFSLTAPGDPIHYVQSLPGNPHGHDPDTTPGVTRLDTGYYSTDAADPGALVAGGAGHGGYWRDPDSTAFRNIVAVINDEQPTPYVERAPDLAGATAIRRGRDVLAELGRDVLREWLKHMPRLAVP